MKTLKIIMLIVSAIAMTSCFSMRPSKFAFDAKIGSTSKAQLINKCDLPYKMSANYDENNDLIEHLYYKESVAPASTYYSGGSATTHIFIFKNGILQSIANEEDETPKIIEKTITVNKSE